MRIAILVAMDKELRLLLSAMPEHKEVRIGESIYYEGCVGSHNMVVGKCGIGKVNAALNTYRLITETHPDLVINSGVAGGAGGMKVGDVLVADRVAYHDVWCGPGTEYGAADGFGQYFMPWKEGLEKAATLEQDICTGLICSGDKFIHTAEEVSEIRSHFPDAVAVDMESAAIAQTCSVCGVPFMIIRVMSDTPGEGDNVSQYNDFWGKAPEKTFECVRAIIGKL